MQNERARRHFRYAGEQISPRNINTGFKVCVGPRIYSGRTFELPAKTVVRFRSRLNAPVLEPASRTAHARGGRGSISGRWRGLWERPRYRDAPSRCKVFHCAVVSVRTRRNASLEMWWRRPAGHAECHPRPRLCPLCVATSAARPKLLRPKASTYQSFGAGPLWCCDRW